MSKEIRMLEDILIEDLNKSAIPHEAKRLVLMYLLNEENKLADAEIINELKEEGENENG